MFWIVIVTVFVAIVYSNIASFYRSSAREIKRLDSMLRSVLFAHFAESFTGLPTIRSYGVLSRFIEQNRLLVDLQDRALLLTVTNQRSVPYMSCLIRSSDSNSSVGLPFAWTSVSEVFEILSQAENCPYRSGSYYGPHCEVINRVSASCWH